MVGPDSRHHLFDRALSRADWTNHQAWLQTIAAGGTRSVFDLETFLHVLRTPPARRAEALGGRTRPVRRVLCSCRRSPGTACPERRGVVIPAAEISQ